MTPKYAQPLRTPPQDQQAQPHSLAVFVVSGRPVQPRRATPVGRCFCANGTYVRGGRSPSDSAAMRDSVAP